MTKNKSKIPYEAGTNHLASADYIRARNEEMYLNKLREVTGNLEATFEDEAGWLKQKGKPRVDYSRKIAVKCYCKDCNLQQRSGGHKIDCPNRWTGEPSPNGGLESCPLNVYRGSQRYMPKGTKKLTLKSAITTFCKMCQGSQTLVEVKSCTAVDCFLWPYRYGGNPWSSRQLTEEHKQKLRDGLAKINENRSNI